MSEAKLCMTCECHPLDWLNRSMCNAGVAITQNRKRNVCPGPDFGCTLHKPKPADPFVTWLDNRSLALLGCDYLASSAYSEAKNKYLEFREAGKI